MTTLRIDFKEYLIKFTAVILFYSGMLKVINRVVNRFQTKKNEEGNLVFPFLRKRQVRNVQILTYHRVNDEADFFFPAVPIGAFEKQMEYLASHFNICSLEEAVERIKKKDVPENAVVITFDDGYRDNYTNAFPILKRLSIPATIFLATGSIGSGKVLWHDRVFSAFRETQESVLLGYGGARKEYPLGTFQDKYSSFKEILQFLRWLNDAERLVWIDRLAEKLKAVNRKEIPDLMLTWQEVRIMRQGGICFGSHTVTHPILSRLSSEQMKEEIVESKRIIEENLGEPAKTFAYPNGTRNDFNDLSKQFLMEAGYTCAVTTMFGTNEGDQDLFELKRGGAWDHDIHQFGMKLNYYKLCT